MDFGHIAPTPLLEEFCRNRPFHLTLAHLVKEDKRYVDFYRREKQLNPDTTIVLDNSGFECYKWGIPYFSIDSLIDLGSSVGADYVVMTDYPGRYHDTLHSAKQQAPALKEAGFGTFFVPQSYIPLVGYHDDTFEPYTLNETIEQLFNSFLWALTSSGVDYIGVSILAIPNAYGVERDNKLQRYLSRYWFVQQLNNWLVDSVGSTILQLQQQNNKKIHFLGMVDGPNEIALIAALKNIIRVDSWDSSSAVWAGLNGVKYDQSPTGLINGKIESEVDFNLYTPKNHDNVRSNMEYIDELARRL